MAAAALFAGCSKTVTDSRNAETGVLKFSVSPDVDYGYNERGEGVLGGKTSARKAMTKAADSEAILASMVVTISNKDGIGEPRQWAYAEMPSILELTEGEYEITAASSGDVKIAAWDQPVFGGSEEFTILSGRTSTVELICGITNVKVTMNCTEEFRKEFPEYSITVSSSAATEDDGILTWTPAEVEAAKEGFFAVSDLTVTVQAYRWSEPTGQKDPVSAILKIKDVEAKDHITVNIDAQATGSAGLGDSSGAGASFITIDDGTNDRDESIWVGGLEEIPVPGEDGGDEPEPEVPAAPSLVWEANPDFSPMEIKDGMDVNLVVNVPGKIATFVVGVQSSVLEPVVGTNMDLIYDETFIENFGSLLPTGDKLLGQTSVDFSLSSLVPLIGGLGAEPGSEHIFTLKVTDEYGQPLVEPLTFVMPAE